MSLERIVATVSNRLKVGNADREIGLDFLTDRFETSDGSLEYQNLTDSAQEDELQLFYYMNGVIPINRPEGPKRVRFSSDLFMLRPIELGVLSDEKRLDSNLFRLYKRISAGSGRGGPSWSQLIDLIGSTEPIKKRFGRSITYDDLSPVDRILSLYMTGKQEIEIMEGSEHRTMRILSVEDLKVLKSSDVHAGVDVRLHNLWRRVSSENGSGIRISWSELIDNVGKRDSVSKHFGRRVSYGDASLPTPAYDSRLLHMYLLGEIPVHTAEGYVTPRTVEDLYVFRITEHGQPNDKNIAMLEKRVRNRKYRGLGQGFRHLFNQLGGTPAAREKYGQAVTYRDVQLQTLMHAYSLELEAFMLGEREINVGGTTRRISSIDDMPMLGLGSASTDEEVKRLGIRINEHSSETGIRFYDLVNRVGSRPRVVEAYGRPITHLDVSPDFAEHSRRRLAA